MSGIPEELPGPAPPAAQEAGPNAPAERGAWRNMDLPWLNNEFQEKPIENQWAGGDPPNYCELDRLTLLANVRETTELRSMGS